MRPPIVQVCLVASSYSQNSAMCAAMSSLVSEAVRALTFIATPTTPRPHRVPYAPPPDDALARFLRSAFLLCRAPVDHDL